MAQYSDTNLIVNYLPQDLSDEQLQRLFDSRAPGVRSVKICRNNATGYSYGYGFCDYHTHEAALRAIDLLNGHQLGHKTLKVAFARMRSEETRNCKLHISCLPLGVTEDHMRAVLARYGSIISCRLLHNSSQQLPAPSPPVAQTLGRGLLGFCLFETHSSAQAALSDLHNRPWPGGGGGGAGGDGSSVVQVRFADENEKKVRAPLAGRGGGGRPYQQPQQQQYQPQYQPQQQQQHHQFYRPGYGSGRQRVGGAYGAGSQQQQQQPAWYTSSAVGGYQQQQQSSSSNYCSHSLSSQFLD